MPEGHHEGDKSVPSWDGNGGVVKRDRYLKDADAYRRGCKADDRKLVPVRLWRRLEGEAKERLIQVDLDELERSTESEPNLGWERYREVLITAFPESDLRMLPRLYYKFFQKVRFRGDMDQMIQELRRAKAELEAADTDAKVSDGIMGYHTLVISGLSPEEIKHVIGLAQNKMTLAKIEPHLTSLYPNGSYHKRRHGYMTDSYLAFSDQASDSDNDMYHESVHAAAAANATYYSMDDSDTWSNVSWETACSDGGYSDYDWSDAESYSTWSGGGWSIPEDDSYAPGLCASSDEGEEMLGVYEVDLEALGIAAGAY